MLHQLLLHGALFVMVILSPLAAIKHAAAHGATVAATDSTASASTLVNAYLESKVGQMLLVGFDGVAAHDAGVQKARADAEAGHIGGLILHSYNVQSPQQLRALIAYMRTWQVPARLLICIDQEGGAVQRLRAARGFTDFPSAYAVAQQGFAAAEANYTALAQELADLDIDLNFGPVVDLHDADSAAIGARGRSFAVQPEDVVEFASIFITAHRRAGVKTAIKHFAGHGAARGDTHRGFADVTDNYDSNVLEPYIKLIEAGLVDSIMTAHLTNRHLDPSGVPITLSRPVLQGLLRGTLRYTGMIISDDLQMGALTQHNTLDEILQGSLVAGHDILLFSQNAAADGYSKAAFRAIDDLWEHSLTAVQQALAQGSLTMQQLDASFQRIESLKNDRLTK